ncbi:hypothetical protein ACFU99_32125 [Streptomyces sp. NPDC057654]|uniref:hypothetical protein n=1 Tax=Streptomyces sp. NPDC057654 TaxID=3346196 RepID=UPI003677D75E
MKVRGSGARRAVLASAVVLVAAVGCSDDSGGTEEPATPPPASASASSPPSAESGEPSSPSGARPPDEAAARREVKENWEKFFDPATTNDEKADLLQNGRQLKPLLLAFSGDKRGSQVKARVSGVTFSSATEAEVRYALLLSGQTALPGASGTSVYQDKVWKVSVKTLCALVKLSGDAPKAPGC